MTITKTKPAERSSTDIVFDTLYEEISSLELLPGAKISEAEIARRFGVSRQPVRDAFNRLESHDLLLIRPQRATRVQRFSLQKIANTRFLRLAVELEVIERACAVWDKTAQARLAENLDKQQAALSAQHSEQFQQLDYRFHQLIFSIAGQEQAFAMIQTWKRQLDRICVLSWAHENEATAVFEDHLKIAAALANGDAPAARDQLKQHLSRLDKTIAAIHRDHAEYFQ